VLLLLMMAGCATVDKPASTRPAGTTNSTESSGSSDYPMWGRAMGWLLTPFTSGASGNIQF
jgi:hypothetical protein